MRCWLPCAAGSSVSPSAGHRAALLARFGYSTPSMRVFTPRHEGSAKYIAWSGLTQLEEVVSLDPMLCPSLLPDIKTEYWPHIVNEDFMLNFFVDLEFLLGQVPDVAERNLLCVFRNPSSQPP
jgi:hypothetical protein